MEQNVILSSHIALGHKKECNFDINYNELVILNLGEKDFFSLVGDMTYFINRFDKQYKLNLLKLPQICFLNSEVNYLFSSPMNKLPLFHQMNMRIASLEKNGKQLYKETKGLLLINKQKDIDEISSALKVYIKEIESEYQKEVGSLLSDTVEYQKEAITERRKTSILKAKEDYLKANKEADNQFNNAISIAKKDYDKVEDRIFNSKEEKQKRIYETKVNRTDRAERARIATKRYDEAVEKNKANYIKEKERIEAEYKTSLQKLSESNEYISAKEKLSEVLAVRKKYDDIKKEKEKLVREKIDLIGRYYDQKIEQLLNDSKSYVIPQKPTKDEVQNQINNICNTLGITPNELQGPITKEFENKAALAIALSTNPNILFIKDDILSLEYIKSVQEKFPFTCVYISSKNYQNERTIDIK